MNAHGESDWRKVKSVAPPCAVDGLQASYAANGGVSVAWNPAKRADSYNVNFSSDNGKSWQQMVSGLDATSYSFNKDPVALPYDPGFLVSVQSRKGGITSEWRNMPIARVELTASAVTAITATLTLAGYEGDWWYQADTGPDSTCQGPVTTASEALDGLTEDQPYTYTAYSATGCGNADLLASITFTSAAAVLLEAKNVTATTTMLELSNHTGDWWFKETAPETGSCTAGEADFTNDLSGLIPGTEYTYKAYDVDTCGATHESASVDFTTGGVSVSNLAHSSTSTTAGCETGWLGVYSENCATAFTTGSETAGYTLHSITTKFNDKYGNATGFAFALHEASGNNSGNAISNATLSGSTPDTKGDYTFTCSGAGCQLSANTTYYIVSSATNTGGSYASYVWVNATSTNETKIPTSNGWSIADVRKHGQNNQHERENPSTLRVVATVNPVPTLTASSISGTGATLTIANHSGDWY